MAKPCRQSESMRVKWSLRLGWFIDLAALHPQRTIAAIELIDEIIGRIWNTDGANNFVSLNNHAARSIAFTPRRRHV
jgi:hypothetical protein